LGAVAWINGKTFTAPTCELDVIDRVGGAMDSPPVSSMACSTAKPKMPASGWVGHTVLS